MWIHSNPRYFTGVNMNNNFNYNASVSGVGIPYDDITWYNVDGQPFGLASGFNVIVFNDANNIIDVEGAMAVGGSYYSPRGLSLGFERENGGTDIGYSPDMVRFLVGGNVAMTGPLVVVGHVVTGGGFRAGKGSTYLIGKDNSGNQLEELKYLYQANGGSPYWTPSDKGDHYIIPSYDVPRYIPASRIDANVSQFFASARDSIESYKECIQNLPVNGTIVDNRHEWILRGNDPRQNVFLLDVRPNGLINKGIRAEVPAGSLVIVRIRSGNNAHLQYGLMGEEYRATQTLYVFEDATNIFMEVPADIWGSILAPQAKFHGHPTGGHVSGNAALGSLAVNANSGFEFHLYPFKGGLVCGEVIPEQPEQPIIPQPTCPPCPEVQPCPTPPPCPTCPQPQPCPTCPEIQPCPTPPPCPVCPTCPEPRPCPTCPEPQPCPTCPEPQPCPTCPEPRPCPTCPEPEPCPTCPTCPECPEAGTEYIGIPVPIPYPYCPEQEECQKCPDCLITPGIIFGCVWGCECCKPHEWDVMLYKICNDCETLIYCETICRYGCFKFEVPYDACYLLRVCPSANTWLSPGCKPKVTLKNVGVANFILE
jgi:choice-of-anchor A domain-containing protein